MTIDEKIEEAERKHKVEEEAAREVLFVALEAIGKLDVYWRPRVAGALQAYFADRVRS